jgi:hypothetical protein
MNGQPQVPMFGGASFDLTAAEGALSGTTLEGSTAIDCALTVTTPSFSPDDWRDLYLLVDYEVLA